MALNAAPDEFRVVFQEELKTALRTLPDVEVRDFVGLKNGTALDVYGSDRMYAETCDLMLGICDYASLGLGMEIVFRHFTKKPLLLFVHANATVTRMVSGFAEKENVSLIRYDTVSEIVESVKNELVRL